MQTLANPGSTVIAESTCKLVEGYFELDALGAMPIRGISEPIHIYEVTGLGPLRTHFQLSARRGLTKICRTCARTRRDAARARTLEGRTRSDRLP